MVLAGMCSSTDSSGVLRLSRAVPKELVAHTFRNHKTGVRTMGAYTITLLTPFLSYLGRMLKRVLREMRFSQHC